MKTIQTILMLILIGTFAVSAQPRPNRNSPTGTRPVTGTRPNTGIPPTTNTNPNTNPNRQNANAQNRNNNPKAALRRQIAQREWQKIRTDNRFSSLNDQALKEKMRQVRTTVNQAKRAPGGLNGLMTQQFATLVQQNVMTQAQVGAVQAIINAKTQSRQKLAISALKNISPDNSFAAVLAGRAEELMNTVYSDNSSSSSSAQASSSFSSAFGTIATGAGAGAAIGTAFGPEGTIAGAIIGGVLGAAAVAADAIAGGGGGDTEGGDTDDGGDGGDTGDGGDGGDGGSGGGK